jgi:hypothetical protein
LIVRCAIEWLHAARWTISNVADAATVLMHDGMKPVAQRLGGAT